VRKNILANQPKADLKVYAVWFDVLWTDTRWALRSDLLDDPRVEQFWDPEGKTGRWFLREVTHRQGAEMEWDAYFLYPPEARWTAAPAPLVSWGRTVLGSGKELARNLAPLLRRGRGWSSSPQSSR